MKSHLGFTIIEMTVVLGITALLFAISSLSLSHIIPHTSVQSTRQLLISDLKRQQLHALSGYNYSSHEAVDHGIYFSPTQYILFQGSTFLASDPNNYQVPLKDVTISSNFPGNIIIFQKNNGDILNYQSSHRTITISSSVTQDSQLINLGKYGTIQASP